MSSRDVPSSLFKYFAPDRVASLVLLEHRFSPLSSFNDPFEGRPDVTSLSRREDLRDKVMKNFGQAILTQYENLTPERRAAVSFEDFSQRMRQFADVNMDETLAEYQPHLDSIAKSIPDHFSQHFGVFCLCEKRDSLLMWAHYANSHTGFVVEYDTTHPYFHAKRAPRDEFYHLRKVDYRKERPSAPLTEMDGPEFFLVKSTHWAYEDEWRIVRLLSAADRVIEIDGNAIHLFSYPPEIVRSITIGARATDATVSRLKALLREESRYSGVELFQASPDPSQFMVRFRQIEI